MPLPPLYPIIDFSCFAAKPDPIIAVARYAEELIAAGATLIQLRDKSQPEQPNRFLSCARELRRVTWGGGTMATRTAGTGTTPRATLIINDRVDICLAADADGVHLGQDDLSPESARRIFDSVLSHPIAQSLGKSQLLRERMGRPEESSDRGGSDTRTIISSGTDRTRREICGRGKNGDEETSHRLLHPQPLPSHRSRRARYRLHCHWPGVCHGIKGQS